MFGEKRLFLQPRRTEDLTEIGALAMGIDSLRQKVRGSVFWSSKKHVHVQEPQARGESTGSWFRVIHREL